MPAGSRLVCVQFGNHADFTRRPGRVAAEEAAQRRAEADRVADAGAYCSTNRCTQLYARKTSFETGDLSSIVLVMLFLPLPSC